MKAFGNESIVRPQARILNKLRGPGKLKKSEAICNLDVGARISMLAYPE